MKKTITFFNITAIAAVIVFGLSGCNGIMLNQPQEQLATAVIHAPAASSGQRAILAEISLEERIALITSYYVQITNGNGLLYEELKPVAAFPLTIPQLPLDLTTFYVAAFDQGNTQLAEVRNGCITVTLVAGANPISITLVWDPDAEIPYIVIDNHEADVVIDIQFEEPEWDYTLGDTGPGGGTICYVSAEGFTVEMIDPTKNYLAHYLEAAPGDIDTPHYWLEEDSRGFDLYDSVAIGLGRRNTAIILAASPGAPAALACHEYRGGGKDDWFLGSTEELNKLSANREYVGNLNTLGAYWSSSGANTALGWASVGMDYAILESLKGYTRPIRAF